MRPKKAPKDSLYLFSWHRSQNAETKDAPQQILTKLKTLEKVSKDAVWFTVKESPTGGQHVLVVTNDAKKAKKYALQELTREVESVALDGVVDPVQIPVASLKAALMQGMMEDSSSSDSSEDEEEMIKKKKPKAKAMMPETVEENSLAAQQAAALMQGVMGGSTQDKEAEVVLGGMAKQERRKLKDAVKEVDTAAKAVDTLPAPMPLKMMDDKDTSTSSSSSSCSESDEEDGMMTKEPKVEMPKPPKVKEPKVKGMKKEGGKEEEGCGSSESESSSCGSESEGKVGGSTGL